MAVKWTKNTRSKDIIKEKIRKKISDQRPSNKIHRIDMQKIITAKTRRFK